MRVMLLSPKLYRCMEPVMPVATTDHLSTAVTKGPNRGGQVLKQEEQPATEVTASVPHAQLVTVYPSDFGNWISCMQNYNYSINFIMVLFIMQ